jgi:hypothetical protein
VRTQNFAAALCGGSVIDEAVQGRRRVRWTSVDML